VEQSPIEKATLLIVNNKNQGEDNVNTLNASPFALRIKTSDREIEQKLEPSTNANSLEANQAQLSNELMAKATKRWRTKLIEERRHP